MERHGCVASFSIVPHPWKWLRFLTLPIPFTLKKLVYPVIDYSIKSFYLIHHYCFLIDPSCGKAWTFVRVHGYELEGFDSQVIRNVISKEECQAACLRTPNAQCRSAEYLTRERICRISSDNRRTQMRSFRATAPDVIYMENQCAGGKKKIDNLLF